MKVLSPNELIKQETSEAINDGKISCGICGGRYTARGINTYKTVNKKTKKQC